MDPDFLYEHAPPRPWVVREALPQGYDAHDIFLGEGDHGLEVATATTASKPTATEVRKLWKQRQGRRASPVLLIVFYETAGEARAGVCGPIGEHPPVHLDLDPDQVQRLAGAALQEPNRHEATRFLLTALEQVDSQLPGLRNEGLFATHELVTDVPGRPDWGEALELGRSLMARRGRELVEGLGFQVETHGPATNVLRIPDGGVATAVAVFLDRSEPVERNSRRFPEATPVSLALAQARRENLPFVILTRGDRIRLYSAGKDVGVGRKGRTETYVEADLALLPEKYAGYVPLLFGPGALKPGGTFHDILERSRDFAADLGARLRDRVYDHVVPILAEALARHDARFSKGSPSDERLQHLYEMAMTVLFRLLFVAYGEDNGLLPYNRSAVYTRHALKTKARELADRANAEELAPGAAPVFDPDQDDLWAELQALWASIDRGNADWDVPAYNGGLFSSDPEVSGVGEELTGVVLSNADVGPALYHLLVDRSPDDVYGPVDFRALSVREFGTIYEGLLEASLSVAPTDLTLDDERRYVPADGDDAVVVEAGQVYLQNRSGARKSTGTYYTKHFAVEHLLDHSLEPALDRHLEGIREFLDAGREAEAARGFFDFRCADIAMGSGHFLVAAVDRIEARFSAFLAEHPLAGVSVELENLRVKALEHLGELGAGFEIETSRLLRRQIARRCVYGVDINPIAVELARLALWVHTFVEGLPLSFLNHTIVHGNSLTGVGTLDEAADELDPDAPDGTISMFRQQVDAWLRRAEEWLQRLARTSDATAAEVREAGKAHRRALEAVEPVRNLFDLLVAARQGEINRLEGVSDELVMEHPKLSVARRVSGELDALHFPVVFPEVFLRDNPGFDCIVGNPPWEEATVEQDKFWARHYPGFTSHTQADRNRLVEEYAAQRPDLVDELEREIRQAERVRQSLIAGQYPGMGRGDPDLYKAFCWRFWHLVRDLGRIGVVLPRSALMATGSANWRQHLMDEGQFTDVTLLLNNRHWVFEDVHPQYTLGLVSIRSGGERGPVRLRGPFASEEAFSSGVGREAAEIPTRAITEATPNASFPLLPTAASGPIYRKLREQPSLGADVAGWRTRPVTELHATNEQGEMILDPADTAGLWPVYKGASFNIWQPDTGEYYAWADPDHITTYLQQKRLRQHRHARSAFSEFPKDWVQDADTLPCRHPRIAFRDVTNRTNQRTVIAALIPPDMIVANQAPYLLWSEGDARDEAFLLGVLCSIPLDWYARRIVETHVNFHILNGFPIPRPDPEDRLRRRVEELAGRLAAVDDRYQEWAEAVGVPVGGVAPDEQEDNMAELDAAAALLYGLTEDELSHIFATFHEGWNYQDRLDRVLGHYHRLQKNA